MSFKTRDGKTHQTHVLIAENGLPVDAIATLAGSYIFVQGDQPITYSGGTVTLPVGSDLTELSTARPRYTGKYVLVTNNGQIYYIDRSTINVAARTFVISTSDKTLSFPISIDVSVGWQVAEADIVNRLATTSSAKIDSVEFRDMHFNMQFDGDPVSILNASGDTINPATEEKQDDTISQLGLVNDELDTHTIQLQQINDELNTQTTLLTSIDQSTDATETAVESLDSKTNDDYGVSTGAIRTASQIGNTTGAADFNRGNAGAQTIRVTQASDDNFSLETTQQKVLANQTNKTQMTQITDGVTEAKVHPTNRSLSVNTYEKLTPLLANANWMKLGNYDAITPSFVGDQAILSYYEGGALIGKATYTFVSDIDWSMTMERYINDTDGELLQDDDGTNLNLD